MEHTITEQMVGVDLVKAQFGVAQGQSLGQLQLLQDDIQLRRGYAIQVRLLCERVNPRFEG